MADSLTAAIARVAERVAQTRGVPRWGLVAAVDPARMRVRVRVQPEDVLSGWLPIAQLGAGAGATMLSVPVVGQMAYLSADNAEAEHAVVVGFAHSDTDPVPGMAGAIAGGTSGLQPGEAAILGKGGSYIRLCADGTFFIHGDTNIDGKLTVSGDIIGQQNIRATEDVTDRKLAHGSLATLRDAYNAHTHTQPADSRGDAEAATNTTSNPVS